jgi:hypothetical protein
VERAKWLLLHELQGQMQNGISKKCSLRILGRAQQVRAAILQDGTKQLLRIDILSFISLRGFGDYFEQLRLQATLPMIIIFSK